MTAEDELKEEMGDLVSGSGSIPLRHSIPVAGDTESRLVALELNVEKIYRGIMLAGRQIEDLRNKIVRG
jgi:hypothetical protein